MSAVVRETLKTTDTLVRELFARVRQDLSIHMRPGLLTETDTLERGHGYNLYRAGESLLRESVPFTPRERGAREVFRLLGLLNVHEQLYQDVGLRLPVIPPGYAGGDPLLDTIIASEHPAGMQCLLEGAISAYLTCLELPEAARFRPLVGKQQTVTLKRLKNESQYEYTSSLYREVEAHVVETGERPKAQDILERWKASPTDPIIRVTPQGAMYRELGGREVLLERDVITRRIGYWCEEDASDS